MIFVICIPLCLHIGFFPGMMTCLLCALESSYTMYFDNQTIGPIFLRSQGIIEASRLFLPPAVLSHLSAALIGF